MKRNLVPDERILNFRQFGGGVMLCVLDTRYKSIAPRI